MFIIVKQITAKMQGKKIHKKLNRENN